MYGRWAGWGFGLGWWGRPTPARVTAVTPLSGAVMKGGAEWAVTESAHRVRADLEVTPEGGAPYRASTITWQPSGTSLSGRTVLAMVSRTRPDRVFVPRNAVDAPEPDGRY
jgi:hypothetical protein